MCGIAIAIGWNDAEAAVKTMLSCIMHRGDVTDPVVSPMPNAAMGTRRLRIVDGDHAVQPQISFDGRIWVSFNGEIYNHRELRSELEAAGVHFKTASDTEVIASALLLWGAACLKRFIGMFAFVAIDTVTKEFVAVRDPIGVKPLYYIKEDMGFLFCSEIRPLLKASETGDVMYLPPGFVISGSVYGPYQSRLGMIAPPPPTGDVKQLDALMEEAVRIRLPPDLPTASMFSGGIDSTLVTHYARKYDRKIPGYFLGNEQAPDYEFAARYAEATDLDFRLVPFELADQISSGLMKEIVGCVEAFEPEVIRSSLCSYVVSREIHKDGFRVALCGEGADELFCGYVPLELLFAESATLGIPVRGQCLAQMNRTNLQRVDRCSMKWQLEARAPFMDPSIIVYALSLDAKALVQEFDGVPRGKMPLRALYDLYPDQLPSEIRDRTKIPFNEGAGFDISQNNSPWRSYAEENVSDAHFQDGKRKFAGYSLTNKEEFLYLEMLSETMDVSRVPHLRMRTHLMVPNFSRIDQLKKIAIQ